jgi:hypothetical protein
LANLKRQPPLTSRGVDTATPCAESKRKTRQIRQIRPILKFQWSVLRTIWLSDRPLQRPEVVVAKKYVPGAVSTKKNGPCPRLKFHSLLTHHKRKKSENQVRLGFFLKKQNAKRIMEVCIFIEAFSHVAFIN